MRRFLTPPPPVYFAIHNGELYESGTSLCARRMDAVRAQPQRTKRIDSLTGCWRASRAHGAFSLTCAPRLQKPGNQSKPGAGMCLFGRYWNAVRHNAGSARRRALPAGRFRTDSLSGPSPFAPVAPLDDTPEQWESSSIAVAPGPFRGNYRRGPSREFFRQLPAGSGSARSAVACFTGFRAGVFLKCATDDDSLSP